MSDTFNKTYLDLTRTADKVNLNQIESQGSTMAMTREHCKSMLVNTDNKSPMRGNPKSHDRTQYMNIAASPKERSLPWID
jgi:hypothetical protein